MDLQSLFLSPFILAFTAYYKKELQNKIKNLNDEHVTLCVWHSGEGGVTSNKCVSCITDYINSQDPKFKDIFLISAGCDYQNRNQIWDRALADLVQSKSTIQQLILEKIIL